MTVIMFLIVLLQIVSRYLFKSPVIWTDEVSTLLQVSLTFLGIGYGMRKKSHVELSGVYDRFPETVQHLVSIFTNLLLIYCMCFLVKKGLYYANMQWRIKTMTTQLTNGLFYACVPLGLIEAIVYTGFGTVDHILCLFHKDRLFMLGEG